MDDIILNKIKEEIYDKEVNLVIESIFGSEDDDDDLPF
jgi:hypothetical protein